MRELFVKPEVQSYTTFTEFAEVFQIGAGDVIITNRPILPNFEKEIPEGIPVLCTEDYSLGEPTDVMFDAIQADLAKVPFSRMIAVGGGTAIDLAKGICVSEGRTMDELYAAEPASLKKTKTLICLPTTCGTGSEVTVTVVFDRTRMGTKMGITNYALSTDYAIMIPALLETLPASVFGGSSIDALIHAIESYLNSAQASIASKMFAEKALKMIIPVYRIFREKGMGVRNDYMLEMMLASNFAGIAIANALPTATHAMGYPFASKFHRPHGEACYVFLDVTLKKCLADVRSNKVNDERKATWIEFMNILADVLDMPKAEDEAILHELDALLKVLLERKTLKEYGATPQDCIDFAKSCFEDQQRLLSCAFSPYTQEELVEAYQGVYE